MKLFSRKNKAAANSPLYRQPQTHQTQRVFSYYTASRRQLDTFERQTKHDPVQKRARRQLRSYWFLVICVAFGVVLFGWISTMSKEAYVRIEGPSYRKRTTYQAIATQSLQDDWRNRWKLLLQAKSIEHTLYEALPEARSVAVRSSLFGRKPEVIIHTDAPLAWFDQPNAPSVLLSERGKLLLPELQADNPDPQFSRSSLPSLRNETGVTGTVSMQFFSPEEVNALRQLLYQIQQDKDSQLPQLRLTTAPREIEIREPNRGGYAVRMLLNETIDEQYGALRAAQKQLATRQQTPSAYIDVRLVDRVYVR